MVTTTKNSKLGWLRTVNAERNLLRGMAAAFRPYPRVDRAKWCEDNVRFPPTVTAGDSRVNFKDRPWARDILREVDNPDVETITIVFATQVGKTLLMWLIMLSQSVLRPCPAMFLGPDQDYVREQRDKIYTTAQLTATVRDRIPRERQWNDRHVNLGSMLAYLAWTGSTQRMSGRSCQLVIHSEVDRSKQKKDEGATAKLITERTKAFFRALVIKEGAPIGDDSELIDSYEQSDQRRLLVPCPYCKHYQELRFFPHRDGKFAKRGGVQGLQDDEGNWRTSDELADHVHYVCEKGCKWKETDRMPAILKGVWCPAGQKVDAHGRLRGTPAKSNRHAGFTINSMYSPTVSFLKIAREYLSCRDDDRKMRGFFNNWLALKYHGSRKLPKWNEVGRRCKGFHRRGLVPPQALFLVAGVDVQLDYVVWRVRAFGEGGTSWGIDRGIIHATIGADGMTVPDSDLDKITGAVLNRRFELMAPNALGATQLQVRLLGIDSQYHTLSVHNWRRRQAGDRVRTIGGDHSDYGAMWRKSIVEKSAAEGVVYPGGMERWGIQVSAYQEELRKLWYADLDKDGAWWLESDIMEDGEDYLRQLVNRRTDYGRDRFGRKKKSAKDIDGRIRHDYFDTEVYCLALGNMVVDSNWIGLIERYAPQQQSTRSVARADGAPRDDDDAPR